VGPVADLDDVEKRKFLTLQGLELATPTSAEVNKNMVLHIHSPIRYKTASNIKGSQVCVMLQ
jgi:hypothetical protein